MKTVLVTGANGQLGYALRLSAESHPEHKFIFTDVDTLDITDPEAVRRMMADGGVSYVLNCAAYTAVEKAENDEAMCSRINSFAVGVLGKAAHEAGAKMIHISTDYVFNGMGHRPYVETDETNPLSAYGRTKLAGEELLREVCPDAVILRTAWLYSEWGNNFVKTVLRLGKERDELGFVFDQVGAPTYAGDLAKAMLRVVEADIQGAFVPGIYHFSNEGVCSWYDFAVKILQLANLHCHISPIETKDYPTKAVRPPYSVLNKKKFKTTYNVTIPHWEESLKGCMERMKK